MNVILFIDYFIVYSFFGWILESVYKSVLQKKFINSGFLAGPFCPIYGCGALIMYLSLERFENNYFLLFVFGFVILSILEYIVGGLLEFIFKTKYWDYSEKKFNINGRVCLINSLYWGILGIIFIKLIHPMIEKLVSLVPNNYLIVFAALIGSYIVVDTIITATQLIKVNMKVYALNELNDVLRSKLSKFNNIKSFNKNTVLRGIIKIKRKNRLAINEFKKKRLELIDSVNQKTKRIRRAFPSMKSERIFKYINIPHEQLRNIPKSKNEDKM